MLDEMTPGQFDEWFAYYTIEPFGQEWHQAGTVAAAVDGGFRAIISGLGGADLKADDYPQAKDYVPRLVTRPEIKRRFKVDLESIDRLAQQLEAQARSAARNR